MTWLMDADRWSALPRGRRLRIQAMVAVMALMVMTMLWVAVDPNRPPSTVVTSAELLISFAAGAYVLAGPRVRSLDEGDRSLEPMLTVMVALLVVVELGVVLTLVAGA